jgi:hypothetical protein
MSSFSVRILRLIRGWRVFRLSFDFKILYQLDLEGLRALLHASPVFHEPYLVDRKLLLHTCLESTLGSVTIDACAAFRTGSVEFANERTVQTVTEFIQFYQHRRSLTNISVQTEKFTKQEIVEIVTFYFSIIKPLAQICTNWAIGKLALETKSKQDGEPLSKPEETRLLRALYRFQLCCNLFGVNHETSRGVGYDTLTFKTS